MDNPLHEYIFGTRKEPSQHTDDYLKAEKNIVPYLQRRTKEDFDKVEMEQSDENLQHYELKYHESRMKNDPKEVPNAENKERTPGADSGFF